MTEPPMDPRTDFDPDLNSGLDTPPGLDVSPPASPRVRWTRYSGFLLIFCGTLILFFYALSKAWEPLQHLWPWFVQLDLPIRIGLGAATLGAVILVSVILWERWQDWTAEKKLPAGRY